MDGPRAARVRAAHKLHRRTSRCEARRFLVEGPQVVREALRAAHVEELFVTQQAVDRHADLLAGVSGDTTVRPVTDAAMTALASTINPQGIVGVCRFLDAPLTVAVTSATALAVVLAEVRDPGNAGTVLRTADAAGADAVVVTERSVDVYNPKCVRSSAGSLFHLPVVTGVDLAAAVRHARSVGLGVLLADAGAAHTIEDAADAGTLRRPTAWVFGNEAWGVPDSERTAADAALSVPIHGQAESLNLASSAAVCLYASARAQRRA
ncbi:MAG: TrmH family RNA methyltransferase [Streptosporangiales bacterium]